MSNIVNPIKTFLMEKEKSIFFSFVVQINYLEKLSQRIRQGSQALSEITVKNLLIKIIIVLLSLLKWFSLSTKYGHLLILLLRL